MPGVDFACFPEIAECRNANTMENAEMPVTKNAEMPESENAWKTIQYRSYAIAGSLESQLNP